MMVLVFNILHVLFKAQNFGTQLADDQSISAFA
jgi:hypothetical protein